MFASRGLYALAGLLQWHLELRLNALAGSLLALLVGIVFYQRREISLPGRAGVG